MGILSRTTIIAALLTGASSLHAFQQRTIWFNVPYNVVYPQTTAPTFPPTFAGNQNGDWTTYSDIGSAGIMGLPTGGNAGILVPDIVQLFSDLSVPANLQGDLVSVSLAVDFYLLVNFSFTYSSGGNQTATATSGGDLQILGLEDPAIGFGGVANEPAVLFQSLGVTGSAAIGPGGTGNNPTTGSDSDFNQASYNVGLTSGNLAILADETTPSFATLPVKFLTQGVNDGTGNYISAGQSFGGIRIGITYTFLPESDWAWAGLPLVFGAWAVRRRMANAKAA